MARLKHLGINTTHDNIEVARENEVVFVAVKPNHVSKVCSEIAAIFRRDQLLVSIALGITIRYMEQLLPAKSRVVNYIFFIWITNTQPRYPFCYLLGTRHAK
jgi:pyrroline-5-carboxylate reductase